MIIAPIARGYEYTVRRAVAIPLAWAKILKETGARHYDLKCRQMAECGVVNGLFNVATWNEGLFVHEPSWPGMHPVGTCDCDSMLKIMEQAHYMFDPIVIAEICAWLRRTMNQIEARHAEITGGEGG